MLRVAGFVRTRVSKSQGSSDIVWLFLFLQRDLLVMDLADLFTDHRISGLPICAKYKHFRTF